MQRDPIDFDPITDALFIIGALSSILLVLIPERRGSQPAGPRPPRCSCGCGPAIPTGSGAE